MKRWWKRVRLLDPALRHPPDENSIHLSEFFVIVLIGVAYEAAVEPVAEALRHRNHLFGTLLLLFIFVTVTFRFLVGNFHHLNSPHWNVTPRYVLLYDMCWIGVESVAMIFLGAFTSIESNETAHAHDSVDYAILLMVLFGLDMIWIFTQWCLDRMSRTFGIGQWQRAHGIPWHWFAINFVPIFILLALKCLKQDVLSERVLFALAVINLGTFVFDVLGPPPAAARRDPRPEASL